MPRPAAKMQACMMQQGKPAHCARASSTGNALCAILVPQECSLLWDLHACVYACVYVCVRAREGVHASKHAQNAHHLVLHTPLAMCSHLPTACRALTACLLECADLSRGSCSVSARGLRHAAPFWLGMFLGEQRHHGSVREITQLGGVFEKAGTQEGMCRATGLNKVWFPGKRRAITYFAWGACNSTNA